MSGTWQSTEPPDPTQAIGPRAWLRVALRGGALSVLVLGCFTLLLALRLIERPLCGLRRPITPWLVLFVSRNAFRILGIGHRVEGRPLRDSGAMVANHGSWLDIFALNARSRVYFVSKSEVARWPLIGWMARATGTLFIDRDPARARDQAALLRDRLTVGHTLLFFPEGTSTDGRRVLPFKSTLFAAFFSDSLRRRTWIQPVSVIYRAPPGADPRFYGWWGDMDFGPHLLKLLAAPHRGSVTVRYHDPLAVADFKDRKALAAAAEDRVRAGHASVPDPQQTSRAADADPAKG